MLSGLLLTVALTHAYAQKRVSKVLLQPHISAIVIDGEQCFEIAVTTAASDQVTVEAEMEGEYQGEVLVRTETLGNTLHIGTGFSPVFELPNDKLGAHKVLSVRLKVTMPGQQRVTINGQFAAIETHGQFREVTIRASEGSCSLHHQAEQTRVETQGADIRVYTVRAVVEAFSRHGQVELDSMPPGDHRITLHSQNGDIRVTRVE